MPLIMATETVTSSRSVPARRSRPTPADPHTNTLLHVAFAINLQSQPVQEAGNFIGTMAPGLKANPFGWLGQSIALYADADPFWDRLRRPRTPTRSWNKTTPIFRWRCTVKSRIRLGSPRF